MNNNELVRELEKQMARYGYCDTRTHIEIFIKEYETLTKDKKPIRLKDVIKRIQGFDDETKLKWTYDILKELGSDFGSKMFHEGYQQGRFDEALETHHEPQKVVVPKYVADWIEECEEKEKTLLNSLLYTPEGVNSWVGNSDNQELFARAWLDGYQVEKEKRYIVKFKGLGHEFRVLKYNIFYKDWFTGSVREDSSLKLHHTRKELEDAGFGWVFDCEGIEVEEVVE